MFTAVTKMQINCCVLDTGHYYIFNSSDYDMLFYWPSYFCIGVVTITASRCVQCIGFCSDSHLGMEKQVSQTISAFYAAHM